MAKWELGRGFTSMLLTASSELRQCLRWPQALALPPLHRVPSHQSWLKGCSLKTYFPCGNQLFHPPGLTA